MRKIFSAVAVVPLLLTACQSAAPSHMYPALLAPPKIALVEVAESQNQWTGIAVSHAGRIFVNYPRWSENVPVSVAELIPPHGFFATTTPTSYRVAAFPNEEWQGYAAGKDPSRTLVCVQSVVVDDDDFLWILDTGAPMMGTPVEHGAKLLKVDLHSNQVVSVIPFEKPALTDKSYLNDVRIDTKNHFAYLTDSGDGALVVLNLNTNTVRRVLTTHPSTDNEHLAVVIDGMTGTRDGKIPYIDSDGIALSADGQYLYYKALSGATLYRIQTQYLRNESLDDGEIGKHVESLGKIGPTDGLEFERGESVLFTDLQRNSISRFYHEASTGLNKFEILSQSAEIAWPDSFAIGPDGAVYFTTSQLHLGPTPPAPYKIFKLVSTQH